MAGMVKGKKASTKAGVGYGSQQVSNRSILLSSIWLGGAFIFVIAFGFWYGRVHNDPQRVFWGMISNNLSTPGVTRESNQSANGTNTDEITQLTFGSPTRVHVIKKVTSGSGAKTTKLTLEGIGTPTDDYQRYSSIQRPNSKADYTPLYELWVHNKMGDSTGNPQLFLNAIFGVTLFGNLPEDQRNAVVNDLKSHNAYHVDFKSVQRTKIDGHKVYVFSSALSLHDYASAAKLYAKDLKLSNADKIDPSSYGAGDGLDLLIKVDVSSRQLVAINYKTTKNTETYTGYGIAANIPIPSRVVTNDVFQSTLNKLGQ